MSGILGRRAKSYGEMIADPAFVYQIGRLIGAAEMSSKLLASNSDPEAKAIGHGLENVVNWFFTPEAQTQRTIGRGETS